MVSKKIHFGPTLLTALEKAVETRNYLLVHHYILEKSEKLKSIIGFLSEMSQELKVAYDEFNRLNHECDLITVAILSEAELPKMHMSTKVRNFLVH